MKKEIDKNIAEICEYAYKKGFRDALFLAKKGGFEKARQCLKKGIEEIRKKWVLI